MNTFQELLTTTEYLFLTSISDAGHQELHARLCLGGHKPLPRAIIGKKGADLLAKPIEYENAHYVDVLWKRYLQFSVCDEGVARVVPDQQYEGRCVRLYSQSRLLSSLDEISNGTHVLRGQVKHFGLACMNHIRMRTVAIVVLCSLCAFAGKLHSEGATPVTGNAMTEVCGTLKHEIHWGPPNFGEHKETDSKFTAWLVALSMPTRIDIGTETGQEHQQEVSEIQLSINPTDQKMLSDLESLDKTMVVAYGKLWTGTSPGDVTPAVLALDRIRAAGARAKCNVRQGKRP